MEDGNPHVWIIVFIVLLLLDAVFAGAETAFGGVNEAKIAKRAEDGHKKSRRLLKMIQRPSAFFNAMEFVMTAIAMTVGAHVGNVFFQKIINLAAGFLKGLDMRWMTLAIGIVMTLVLIFLVLVFGMAVPKRIAVKYNEKWAYACVNLVYLITCILLPFTKLVSGMTNVIVRLFGIDPKELTERLTEEEIIMMVSEGHEKGVIEASEAEMISNIFEFDDKEVFEIMTHRKNIVGIEAEYTVDEAIEMILEGSYSRYPVYESDIDNIIGILHFKDAMRQQHGGNGHLAVKDVMRQPYFVPETKNINELFSEMQSKKVHMAIVIDEYGQTGGLIAMEDILEEIVGNILDEYDVDETFIHDLGDGTYRLQGLTPLEDIEDLLDVEFDTDEFDTLNGFLISRLERIPSEDEKVTIQSNGYGFDVLSVENNTIREVLVYKLPAVEEEEAR